MRKGLLTTALAGLLLSCGGGGGGGGDGNVSTGNSPSFGVPTYIGTYITIDTFYSDIQAISNGDTFRVIWRVNTDADGHYYNLAFVDQFYYNIGGTIPSQMDAGCDGNTCEAVCTYRKISDSQGQILCTHGSYNRKSAIDVQVGEWGYFVLEVCIGTRNFSDVCDRREYAAIFL